ncbi:MAG: glycosyltransferase [Candidatus Scalinduaceae bacterium]
MSNQPFVSVIIPIHNGGKHIEKFLDALITSSYPSFEIIMVDDCSTDNSVEIARQKGITILQLSRQSGPAFARNFGAKHARGEILLFIDSDVAVRRETISSVVVNFQHNSDIVAVFGSYDDDPAEGNFISQYKNLFHHFHHQYSNTEASTFWSGCGAIRKNVFEEIGGFNQKRYTKASIEDIELGYRIRKKGHRILLDKSLQVKHLKRWEFLPILRTDIFQRAIPWSRLILETKFMPKDLNLQISHRISSISVVLMILVIPILLFNHTKFYSIPTVLIAGLLSLMFLILNRKLYVFYIRRRGFRFMLQVIPLHLLYYFYSGTAFVICWITYRIPTFISSILW